jgi:hypothetical protein
MMAARGGVDLDLLRQPELATTDSHQRRRIAALASARGRCIS